MIKPIYGTSMIVWISPIWSNENACYAIQQSSKAGFDLIELCLPPSMDLDIRQIQQTLQQNKIAVSCGLNLPSWAHIPTHPKEALQLVKTAIDITKTLGGTYLGGVLHSAIGAFSGTTRTEKETDIIVNVWGEMAQYALKKGITIGIEPINRYESYVCTSANEVLTMIGKTGMSNLVLHLDTFHMNIEESNFKNPILEAKEKLKYVHMTDSDRGILGGANVHWDDFFQALNDIDYSGPLVLENFTNKVPGIRETTSLWRDSPLDAHALATGSLAFMKQMVDRYSTT